jgi:hypothetical protein
MYTMASVVAVVVKLILTSFAKPKRPSNEVKYRKVLEFLQNGWIILKLLQ